jgi:hypothetical protein
MLPRKRKDLEAEKAKAEAEAKETTQKEIKWKEAKKR